MGTATLVLFTLAAGQFLMTLESSVMNVSIATVAKDVGTTVTGIQGAITAYTLVMATLMITGAKIGALIGRKRAFAIGCVIYGCGSLTTALSPSLPVLLFGWSLLEGVGAALILPAIVALVASNVPTERRPAAYGLVAAAGAIAVAVGPLIGGFFTTYFSWRWVFAGEVVIVLVILLLTRRIADAPSEERPSLDLVGTALSAAGLGMLVFGVLRSSEWGWIQPKADGPSWAGLSPTVWLILGGLFVIWLFSRWEVRRASRGEEPLVRPGLVRNKQLSGGLIMFFFQYLVQAGLLLLAVTLVLLGALDADAGAEIVFVPMLLVGLGIGALASQLGSVTVSAVPDDQSPEVGRRPKHDDEPRRLDGDGARRLDHDRRGHDLVSSQHPAEPGGAARGEVPSEVELAGGVPFISDADLEAGLDEAGASSAASDAALEAYADARIDGLRSALAILAALALGALFFTQRIPSTQPGAASAKA